MDLMKWARFYWDRLGAAVLAVLGLLTLLLGYLGVSGTVYPAEQLPYMISGGILGLFFLGSAGILYLSADMRDEWRKLDSIDASLKELAGVTTRDEDPVTPAAASPGTPPTPVAETPAPSTNGSEPAEPAAAKTTTRKKSTTGSAKGRSTGQRTGSRS